MTGRARERPEPCSLETLLACERQYLDLVSIFARRQALRTTIEPIEPTAAEIYLWQLSKRQMVNAREGYLELRRRQEGAKEAK